MDELQWIERLGNELKKAAKDHDWQRLQKINTRITELLISSQSESLSVKKIQTLKCLQSSHQQAFDYCQQQSQLLEKKISLYRNNQNGLSAYANMAVIAHEDIAEHGGMEK